MLRWRWNISRRRCIGVCGSVVVKIICVLLSIFRCTCCIVTNTPMSNSTNRSNSSSGGTARIAKWSCGCLMLHHIFVGFSTAHSNEIGKCWINSESSWWWIIIWSWFFELVAMILEPNFDLKIKIRICVWILMDLFWVLTVFELVAMNIVAWIW